MYVYVYALVCFMFQILLDHHLDSMGNIFNRAKAPVVEEESGGMHLFEIHAPSAGVGSGIVIGLIALALVAMLVYRCVARKCLKKVHRSNLSTLPASHGIEMSAPRMHAVPMQSMDMMQFIERCQAQARQAAERRYNQDRTPTLNPLEFPLP